MKAISQKQSAINRKLKKVYKELELERGHYCSGCGKSDVPLSHSHLIPRSRRQDLVTDKRNITYHCLDSSDDKGNGRKGCHTMWEGKDRDMLMDYHRNMEYILEVDVEYYHIITDLNGR